MASYFLDTSALVKRHVAEPGHAWIRSVCVPRARNTIAVAEISLVETIASFSRMAREAAPRLTLPRRNRVISDFERCFRQQYVDVEVNRTLLMRADLPRR